MQTLPTLAVPADCEWARPWFPVDPMDLLHQPSAAHTQWTTVNLGEVFPGVPTPLNWAVLGAAGERGLRDALHAIGCYKASETQIPADPSQRTIGIMWGRAVANLDVFRNFADRMPGSSGDAMEAQIFGSAASINSSQAVYTRYPVVLAKMPFAAIQRRRQLVQLSEATEQWWHDAVFPSQPRDRLAATALLWEAHRRIAKIFDPHNVMMMVALGVFTQVRSLVASVGLSEIETKLMYTGDTAESQTVADLWRLSREQLSMQTFLSHHGFHGPRENEVSGYVWREDQTPLLNLVTRYRDMGEDASPLKAADERLLARADAERQLMSQLSPLQRVRARLLLKLARYYVPTREMGRDAFLKGMDVVRYAARVIGTDLVAHGLLDQVDDTFYLTPFELTELPDGLRERVALRRQKRAHYETLDLPERWTGLVEPQAKSKPADNVKVAGLGVSAGVVEGRVRVVLDPAADELEPDELLVCRTTDPGWASYFFIAAGVIIDIGGPLSHGAIIARELGLPCVINAKNATEQLRTGDLVRMDGTTGQVDVLERAPQGDTA
ncbi:MAG TPA: PEP-utilizing enzyme [Macromonas sp.]|nr:PEP-utilizing enzyme [Macromonas sp.]